MRIRVLAALAFATLSFTACEKDGEGLPPVYPKRVFNYAFNTGQVAGKAAYSGQQPKTLQATLTVDSLRGDSTMLTVELKNTRSGMSYPVGAYDAADTGNYGYAWAPNARILSQTITGNGGTATATQRIRYRYDSLIHNYNGYFIVRDVQANAGTLDSIAAQSQLIFGTFAR